MQELMNPIRIIHLITTLDVGGAEMMLLKLTGRMDCKYFQNHVISLTDIGRLGLRMQDQGTHVHALNMPHGSISLRGIIKLYKLIKLTRPDLIQTWLYHADLLGTLMARLLRIKSLAWNIRCTNIELKNYGYSTRISLSLSSLLSHLPDVIITNSSKAQEDHMLNGYRPKRWMVIPNGFDTRKFKPDESARHLLFKELGLRSKFHDNKNNTPYLIGLIARYDPMKNHDLFIKAACLILNEGKDVHFILAGRDITWQNMKLAAEIPVTRKSHFHLLGQREDIEYITAALDVATCASSYGEGFSNVIGEAMACGVPCVATDVGDSAFLVDKTGIIVPRNDPLRMAEGWKRILTMSMEERRSLGETAQTRIRSQFSIDLIARRYEDLYRKIFLKDLASLPDVL